jgi:uncharacterized protein YjdB
MILAILFINKFMRGNIKMKSIKLRMGIFSLFLLITVMSNFINPINIYDRSFKGVSVSALSYTKVKSVKLSKTAATIYTGGKTTLKATISPSNATNKSVKWTTSNSKVATVSNGVITAKGVGTAIIKATTVDGRKVASSKITVKKPVKVTSVKVSKSSTTLYLGGKYTLKATISPSNATNKSVKWTTSNSKIATVSNGVVTAKGVGTAIIKATTVDGRKVASSKITVKKPVKVTSVKVSKSSATLYLGGMTTLVATISPSNATNRALTWTTSNSKVATVSNGVVTAKGVGTAIIKATTVDGRKVASSKITVKKPVIKVSSVKLNKTSATLNVGGMTTLVATISPSNATNKALTWTTSNSGVATVSNGVVTAKGVGTAIIKVTTIDSGKTSTCSITVKPTYEEYKSFTYSGSNGYVIGGAGQLDYGKLTSKATVQEFNEETANIAKYAGLGASESYLKSKMLNKRVGKYLITDVDISFYIGNGLDEYNFPLDTRGVYEELLTKGLGDVPTGLFSVAVRKLDFASDDKYDGKCRAVKVIVKFKEI